MIKIAICDDERESLDSLKRQLEDYFSDNSRSAVKISVFSSAQELLNVAETDGFDIYIFDIIMPGMNGIDLGIQLRRSGDNGIIIYLTYSPEYAVDSYEADAFFYLLKPVDTKKLRDVINRAVQSLDNIKKNGIVVKTSDGEIFLPYDRIMYAELKARSVHYALSDGSYVNGLSLRVPFKRACAELTKDRRFVICGASFCINLSFVTSLGKSYVTLKNGSHILLPKKAVENMNSLWLDFWLEG